MTRIRYGEKAKATTSTTRTIYIDGTGHEFKSIPNCTICQSEHRDEIERGLILGRNYLIIANSLPDDADVWFHRGERITEKSMVAKISRHSSRNHSNIDVMTTRIAMEAHARKAGLDLAGAEVSIVTDLGLLDEIKRRGYEAMIRSNTQPTLNQTLKAAALSLQYQEVAGDSHAVVFQAGIMAFMEVLSRHFDDDTLRWIIADLDADPAVATAFTASFDSDTIGSGMDTPALNP